MILLLTLFAAAVDAASAPLLTPPRVIGGQITARDYPPAALRREAAGKVHARLAISEGGIAVSCSIAASSGHADLDRRVCDLALTRMRFSPALDSDGRAMAVHVVLPVVWALEPRP